MDWISAKNEYLPPFDESGFYVLSFIKNVPLKEKYCCEGDTSGCVVVLQWEGIYKLNKDRIKNIYTPNIETLRLENFVGRGGAPDLCYNNHRGTIDFFKTCDPKFYISLVRSNFVAKASLKDLRAWFKIYL